MSAFSAPLFQCSPILSHTPPTTTTAYAVGGVSTHPLAAAALSTTPPTLTLTPLPTPSSPSPSPSALALPSHTSPVSLLAFDPLGMWLVAAHSDGALSLVPAMALASGETYAALTGLSPPLPTDLSSSSLVPTREDYTLVPLLGPSAEESDGLARTYSRLPSMLEEATAARKSQAAIPLLSDDYVLVPGSNASTSRGSRGSRGSHRHNGHNGNNAHNAHNGKEQSPQEAARARASLAPSDVLTHIPNPLGNTVQTTTTTSSSSSSHSSSTPLSSSSSSFSATTTTSSSSSSSTPIITNTTVHSSSTPYPPSSSSSSHCIRIIKWWDAWDHSSYLILISSPHSHSHSSSSSPSSSQITFFDLASQTPVISLSLSATVTGIELVHDTRHGYRYALLSVRRGGTYRLLLEIDPEVSDTPEENPPPLSIVHAVPNTPPYAPELLDGFPVSARVSSARTRRGKALCLLDAASQSLKVYSDSLASVYPDFVYHMYPSTRDVVLTDTFLFARVHASGHPPALLVISNLLAASSGNAHSDAVLQTFIFPSPERLLGVLPPLPSPATLASEEPALASILSLLPPSGAGSEGPSQVCPEYGFSQFFVATTAGVYTVTPTQSPSSIFKALLTRGVDPLVLGKTVGLDVLLLYEQAGDDAFARGEYGEALSLYAMSNVDPISLVAHFVEVGQTRMALSFVRSSLSRSDSLTSSLRTRLSDIAFHLYLSLLLSLAHPDDQTLRRFEVFLMENPDYDATLALTHLGAASWDYFVLLVGLTRDLLPEALALLMAKGKHELDILSLDILVRFRAVTHLLDPQVVHRLFSPLPPSLRLRLLVSHPSVLSAGIRFIPPLLPSLNERGLRVLLSFLHPETGSVTLPAESDRQSPIEMYLMVLIVLSVRSRALSPASLSALPMDPISSVPQTETEHARAPIFPPSDGFDLSQPVSSSSAPSPTHDESSRSNGGGEDGEEEEKGNAVRNSKVVALEARIHAIHFPHSALATMLGDLDGDLESLDSLEFGSAPSFSGSGSDDGHGLNVSDSELSPTLGGEDGGSPLFGQQEKSASPWANVPPVLAEAELSHTSLSNSHLSRLNGDFYNDTRVLVGQFAMSRPTLPSVTPPEWATRASAVGAVHYAETLREALQSLDGMYSRSRIVSVAKSWGAHAAVAVVHELEGALVPALFARIHAVEQAVEAGALTPPQAEDEIVSAALEYLTASPTPPLLAVLLSYWARSGREPSVLESVFMARLDLVGPPLASILEVGGLANGSANRPWILPFSSALYRNVARGAIAASRAPLVEDLEREASRGTQDRLWAEVKYNLGKDTGKRTSIVTNPSLGPSDDALVVFSCSHTLSWADLTATALPRLETLLTALPIAIPLTTSAILQDYSASSSQISVACPSCVYAHFRADQLARTSSRISEW